MPGSRRGRTERAPPPGGGTRSRGSRPSAIEVPDKPYFKIGEVARIVGVQTHVLRYWEQEFSRQIRPERGPGKQRRYRRRDVEAFLRIKTLRYDDQVGIAGARTRLATEAGEVFGPAAERLARSLRDEIEKLLRMIDEDEQGE